MILRFLRSAFGQDLFRDFDDTLHSALPDFPEGLFYMPEAVSGIRKGSGA